MASVRVRPILGGSVEEAEASHAVVSELHTREFESDIRKPKPRGRSGDA